MGLAFPNPLGIAAGFDKDARVVGAVLGMGLGFAEIGTVTPRPQRAIFARASSGWPGNAHLSTGSASTTAAMPRRWRGSQRRPPRGIVGVNVGANKDAPDRAADYVEGIRCFYDVAGYFSVNVSSPNTPGLRDLQAPAALDDLLARVLAARSEMMAAGKPRRPIVVKLAPDHCRSRPGAGRRRAGEPRRRRHRHRQHHAVPRRRERCRLAQEAGGLSGRPLFHRSTVMLARVYRLTQGRVPLIGIGGIDSGADGHRQDRGRRHAAAALHRARLRGAGPHRPHQARPRAVRRANKLARIGDATGRRAEDWAARPLEP